MSLTKFELKKIILNPVTLIAIAVILLLNLYTLFFGRQTGNYKANETPFDTDIVRLQEEMGHFAGEINEEWYQKFIAEKNEIINNPANHVSGKEKEQILQNLKSDGMTDEMIAEMGNIIFLKDSNIHGRYEDMEFSSHFYENAKAMGSYFAQQYREQYPGEKGEALAAKTEEMYNSLADEYKAYYNYNYGYHKLRNIHSTYLFTIGLLILIGLAPIFAAEYSGKTDALLLTSKHGKKRLIHAKIKAGLLFAVLSWGVIQLINTLLIFSIYGTTGAEAYWQDWNKILSPFAFNQWQITLVTVATCLIGSLFLACIVMLISAFSKNQFISLLAGGFLFMFPAINLALTDNNALQGFFDFTPVRILTAANQWQSFKLFYLFGNAIPAQYVILTTAIVLSGFSACASFFIFKRHQVEN